MLKDVRRTSWLLLVALLIALAPSGNAEECDVTTYFVSPSVDGVIEARVISALDSAQDSLLIAMYSFTDDQIGAAVIRAEERGGEGLHPPR